MQLEHDARAAPCKLPRGQRGRSFIGALHEQDLRTKRAQLPRDPKRQGGVEDGAVDTARAKRWRKTERRIVAVGPGRRAREDAQIERLAERIPLASERGIERQPVARPPDEQDARLHRAISSSFCSSSPKTRAGVKSATDGAAPARSRSRSSGSEK